MLKIENLHKIYGKYHALNGLNMTVRKVPFMDLWGQTEQERQQLSRS